MSDSRRRQHDRFGGRVDARGRLCAAPGCDGPGEFRAPAWAGQRSSWDGPGVYLHFCLDHVREFNAGYDFFSGMNADQIYEAQHPASAWRNAQPQWPGGSDPAPRWADFADPLDAIGARFRGGIIREAERRKAAAFSSRERRALDVLGLDDSADRKTIRKAYSAKLRLYHPDRNGGDRSLEKQLDDVLNAWQTLRKSVAFCDSA